MRNTILLYINGKRIEITGETAFLSLSGFLRYHQQAVGTKVVCEEGDCGSCTVLLGRLEEGEISYKPVNSCIQYLYQLDCTHIVTIEGLKNAGQLSPVQEAMIENHGAQCGFCTPGFVVALTALYDAKQCPATSQEIKDACTGNLCRCTGYEPIIRAGMAVDYTQLQSLHRLYPSEEMKQCFLRNATQPVLIEDGKRTLFLPVDPEEAVTFKAAHPDATLVSGGTDVHVWRNKRDFDPEVVMSLCKVTGLDTLLLRDGVLTIGAKVRLSEIERFIQEKVPAFYTILTVFGSPQIKHAGTLAGNIANASPIADTLPFLFVMDAEIELLGLKGSRRININQFYKGYKQLDMASDELIYRVHLPLPSQGDALRLYKLSKRKNLDISTFTAAFLMKKRGNSIEAIRIAYGGVGPVVLRLPRTETYLTGKPFTEALFQEAGGIARSEITPISDVRGAQEYRFLLAENVLLKFFHEVAAEEEGALRCP